MGHPNCGKSTLFNALTQGALAVGNWPGVTVECHRGDMTHQGVTDQVIDLPGLCALDKKAEGATDAAIAQHFILDHAVDVVVNVVDASHLAQQLYLTLQLREMGVPMIVALNMMDVAKDQQIEIDVAALSRELGCVVVPMSARKGRGVMKLREALSRHSPSPQPPPRPRMFLAGISSKERGGGSEALSLTPEARYHRVDEIIAVAVKAPAVTPPTLTDRIDHFALSRMWGLPIFFGVMFLMFACGIGLGSYFQTYFDRASEFIFVEQCTRLLTQWHAPAWCVTLFANGLGRGLNTILTFVPVLASFFLFLSFLEDSGYMMRAVFLVDRLMRRLGLPGQAFVPMIIGFGCNVPAVLAARTLPTQRDRLLTILMTPFMSCSARLTIYAIFAAIFFPQHPAYVVFALYLIGLFAALLTGFFLRNTVLQAPLAPLLMTLPAYHRPHFKILLRHTLRRLKDFIYRAGKVIVPVCMIMALLNAYSFDGGIVDASHQSMLSNMGHHLTPLFAPIGIHADNWPATVSLMTGVLAKEVVMGTLNTLYAPMGDTGAAMSHLFGGAREAFAYLLFVLLYFPCISTLAVMLREMRKGWAIFSMGWMLLVAYGLATLFYQSATLPQHPLTSLAWCVGVVSLFALTFAAMRWLSRQKIWLDQADKSSCATSLCKQSSGCLQCPLRRVY
jgi:ferrous iron transport protein B